MRQANNEIEIKLHSCPILYLLVFAVNIAYLFKRIIVYIISVKKIEKLLFAVCIHISYVKFLIDRNLTKSLI